MKVLGITGLIGAGKSVVRETLSVLYDIPCFDSDTIAKEVYFSPTVAREIYYRLGFNPTKDGLLNKALLKKTLAEPFKRCVLEEIVHRAVGREFEIWKEQQRSKWVCLESAILFTSGFNLLCDFTLAVEASEEIRHHRVQLRDNKRSIEELRNIDSLQTQEGRKQREGADYRINNCGTSSVIRAVEALWEQINNS